jgi:hypothetical protein
MGCVLSRTMGRLGCAVMISVVSQAHAGAADISPAELTQLGMKAAVFKRADPFSPPFDDHAALGRTFRIVTALERDDFSGPPGRNGGWRYEYDAARLDLSVKTRAWITSAASEKTMGSPLSSIDGFELRYVGKDLGHGLMRFGYWGKRMVSFGELTSVGVGPISAAAQAASVRFDPTWRTLVAQISAPPDEARTKAKGAVVVVEGQIAALDNGSASLCDEGGTPATFREPYSIQERFCVFNAIIQRVAIESGGQTLAEWKRPPDFGTEFWPDDQSPLAKLLPAGGHGVVVKAVSEGSPAEKAGLKAMDIIVRFNGIEVYGSEDMSIALKSVYSGQSVPVHVSRSGGDTVVDVQF